MRKKGVISHETVGHEQITTRWGTRLRSRTPMQSLERSTFTRFQHEVNVVNLSQSGCGVNKIEERKTVRDWERRTHEQTAREWDPRTHESLVMIDSGVSPKVCPKWFGNSKLEQSDGANCLRGANGKPLQEYGKRRICLKICGQTKQYNFHVVDVTKPILSASSLCEN